MWRVVVLRSCKRQRFFCTKGPHSEYVDVTPTEVKHHPKNPYEKYNYRPPWQSAKAEEERKRAERILSQLTEEQVQRHQTAEEKRKIKEEEMQREIELAEEKREQERDRANEERQKKVMQIFKSGMDGVSQSEALARLFSEHAATIDVAAEVRRGQQRAAKREAQAAATTQEDKLDSPELEFDADGQPIIPLDDASVEGDGVEEKMRQDLEKATREAGLREVDGTIEMKAPEEEEETEDQKYERLETEAKMHELERQLVLEELNRRQRPQTPITPEPNSVLVGDVLMPWPFPDDPTKVVRVAILGTPNSGKSSLVNALTGSKVTAVSPKRNTTRMKTLGVCTRHDTQMVMYDTPGILELENAKKYERDLTAEAWTTTTRADTLVILIDAVKRLSPAEHALLLKAKKWHEQTKFPIVLVLNKCDLESPKSKLIETADEILEVCDFTEVFYISASLGKFVDELQEYLFGLAKPGAWDFPAGESSALSDKERASEIIREKIYCRLNKEIPYGVTQITTEWKDLPDGSVRIHQQLMVENIAQRNIMVGTKGAIINEITRAAEKDIIEALGRPASLSLDVRER